jgi:hypothetical protein
MLTTVIEGSEGHNQSNEIFQSDLGLKDTVLKSSIDTPSTRNELFEDSPLLPG